VRRVLTSVEKLDGKHPGLGTKVRIWLDQGESAEKIQKWIEEQYGASIGKDAVDYHRRNRWAPLKDRVQGEVVTVKAIMELVGGDAGIDEFMSARLLEDVHELKERSLIDAKELFIKIRAQNLKEDEFKFKSGQLKPGGEAELDPAAQELKRKQVMNKIRAIFGLKPLPLDTPDEDPEDGSEETEDQSAEGSAQDDAVPDPSAESSQNPDSEPASADSG